MTAIEAMIYSLGEISSEPEDGEYQSRVVFGRWGDPHWFSWQEERRETWKPRLCSESWAGPFAAVLEPYRTEQKQEGER